MIEEYGQDIFLAAQATNGIGKQEKAVIANMARLTREGFKKLMLENNLDALLLMSLPFRVSRRSACLPDMMKAEFLLVLLLGD